MHYEIAQIATPQPQCRRAHYVGKLAIVAVNQTSTVLETAYPRHLPRWPSTQHTLRLPVQHYALPHELRCRTTSRYLFVLLLRLFVAIVGYINNLQLRSLLNLNPFRATPPRNYNPQKLAANHQAAAIRPASQTPTYSYDDNHLNYDAPCNLRQQPYKRKRQSRPFCLNEMSLYRGYFAPGAVDPKGLEVYDGEWEIEDHGVHGLHDFNIQAVAYPMSGFYKEIPAGWPIKQVAHIKRSKAAADNACALNCVGNPSGWVLKERKKKIKISIGVSTGKTFTYADIGLVQNHFGWSYYNWNVERGLVYDVYDYELTEYYCHCCGVNNLLILNPSYYVPARKKAPDFPDRQAFATQVSGKNFKWGTPEENGDKRSSLTEKEWDLKESSVINDFDQAFQGESND